MIMMLVLRNQIKWKEEYKMTDKFLNKYKKALKDSKTDEEKDTVLNKLYSDGFEDGSNEL